MNKINAVFLLLVGCLLILSGCGTTTPIPAQGGGKRFAVEQALISASARKAIADLPFDKIEGKSVALEISVIADEGGGAITLGGRPYAASILSGEYDRVINRAGTVPSGTSSYTNNFAGGAKTNDSEPVYQKDVTYNGSDAKQFSNLVVSGLLRRNVLINPSSASGKTPDYILEILVDIFGIWRSRTDWFAYNSENLMATTSFEYVLTPLNSDGKARTVGRAGYDATFKETYMFWVGPVDTEIYLKDSKFSQIVGSFGLGSDVVSNIKKEGVSDFVRPTPPAPIILNPSDAGSRRTRNSSPTPTGFNF